VLQCVAVCCSVLQCVAVCCSVLQCVAVCCSVLPCVAVCCSVLTHVLHTLERMGSASRVVGGESGGGGGVGVGGNLIGICNVKMEGVGGAITAQKTSQKSVDLVAKKFVDAVKVRAYSCVAACSALQ